MVGHVNFSWDNEASAWIAMSEDIPGLVLESESYDHLIERVKKAALEINELNGLPEISMIQIASIRRDYLTDDTADNKSVEEKDNTDSERNCYLIARKAREQGCLAVRTKCSKALGNLVSYLGYRTMDKGIEILSVSDMDGYGEYRPYHLVDSEREFINLVLQMK